MVLVRIAYAADLPTPDEVVRSLGDGSARGNGSGTAPSAPAPRAEMPARSEMPRGGGRGPLASAMPLQQPVAREAEAPATARALNRFEDLIALAAEKRDLNLKSALERDVRLVAFEDGKIEIALEPHAPKLLVGDLSKKLLDWTGRRWMVVVSTEQGAPSLRAQADQRKAQLESEVSSDPLVQAVLTRFPGAKIVGVTPPAGTSGGPADDLPVAQDDESDLDA